MNFSSAKFDAIFPFNKSSLEYLERFDLSKGTYKSEKDFLDKRRKFVRYAHSRVPPKYWNIQDYSSWTPSMMGSLKDYSATLKNRTGAFNILLLPGAEAALGDMSLRSGIGCTLLKYGLGMRTKEQSAYTYSGLYVTMSDISDCGLNSDKATILRDVDILFIDCYDQRFINDKMRNDYRLTLQDIFLSRLNSGVQSTIISINHICKPMKSMPTQLAQLKYFSASDPLLHIVKDYFDILET